MILLGTAGTGKSFTVAALTKLYNGILKRACPTAKAAFLIKGETLHSLLLIPVTPRETDSFLPLKDKQLKDLQTEFANIKMIIIDEYSMLSQIMLSKIDLRLRQAKNVINKTFGDISVILIGDPGQLLPVAGATLYDTKLKGNMAQGGYLAYQKFNKVIQLESVMRQQNLEDDTIQKHFMELIPRIRNGESTIEDYNLLLTRTPNENNEVEFENAIRIFNDNESVDNYNFEKLKNLKTTITQIIALNSNRFAKYGNSSEFNNLANVIYLSIGAHITLTSNTWIKKGN